MYTITVNQRVLTSAVNDKAAVVFRSAALFAILYQLRLVAGDLADTAVFSVTLAGDAGPHYTTIKFSETFS